jgi:uncharacterized membrane protein YgdD (TMEM256/DUF423 family)
MCCSRSWTTLGAILAALAVVMGAFGAHGVDSYFVEKYAETGAKTIGGFEVPASYKYLEDFNTAARYHMYHALGLIAVGLLSSVRPSKSLQVAGWSFVLGIVLFSGSLYVLTLTGQTWLGAITPFGGTLMIAGWIALAVATCPCGEKVTSTK